MGQPENQPPSQPTTEEVLQELRQAGNLSDEQIYRAGLDFLRMLLHIIRAGGTIMVKSEDGTIEPLEIFIPGLTTL